MPDYGFGFREFGEEPFGDADWCRIVLWEELPSNMKEDDAAAGYPFRTFVYSMCPSFEWLKNRIEGFRNLADPFKIRADLLEYMAGNFGIEIDKAEPEDYRRTRVSLAARWNIIKGTEEAYVVLCRTHGFEVSVIPLWWNGVSHVASGPTVYNEFPTYTATINGGNTDFEIWMGAPPVEPLSIIVTAPDSPDVVVTDELDGSGFGQFVGYPSSSIDYGWGYASFSLVGTSYGAPYVTYDSVVGGNTVDGWAKTRTHKIRLEITPGAIAGQTELAIADAFNRLYVKLGEAKGTGVVPVHVEILQILHQTETSVFYGREFDSIAGDSEPLDGGLDWVIP